MKKAIFLFLTLAFIKCYSQEEKNVKYGNYILTGGLTFIAGAADGFNQALQFRYHNVKRAFPDIRDQWWDPSRSWTNKYKDGDPAKGARFPGSKTVLVFTTDAYHATRFIEHLLISGALAIRIVGGQKKKWWVYVVETAGYWIINRVGFSLVYNRF
jgi:hypothetical protein